LARTDVLQALFGMVCAFIEAFIVFVVATKDVVRQQIQISINA